MQFWEMAQIWSSCSKAVEIHRSLLGLTQEVPFAADLYRDKYGVCVVHEQ